MAASTLLMLRKLRTRIAVVATPQFQQKLVRVAAQAALTECMLGFQSGTDPYGAKWKPALRGGMTLMDTGRLRNSIHTQIIGANRFRIFTNLKYASIHNRGGVIKARGTYKVRKAAWLVEKENRKLIRARLVRKLIGSGGSNMLRFKLANGQWVTVPQVTIPTRQFLPYNERPLPPRWRDSLDEAVQGYVAQKLRLR